MRVKLAKIAGFCWGVERALDIVLDTANEANGPVYTHGPLIHNPQTVSLLEQKNVYANDPRKQTGDNGLLVIRAHGISPQVRDRLRNSGMSIRDATCPLVAKVHGIIRKHSRLGAFTIIIGEEGHPEVEGHTGYAEAGSRLVTCLEDVQNLPELTNGVLIVAQTTINMDEFAHIVDALKARYPQAVMFNTICDATEERQQDVRMLAPEVDLMVVVGGRNSGNTNRLAEVAREEGAESILIETEEEIDPAFLRRYKRIGVTAGASTPDWMIRRVVNRIEAIPGAEEGVAEKSFQALKVLSRANVLLLLTAAMGSIAAAALAGFPLRWEFVTLSGLYLFCLHTLNRCVSFEADRYNEPNRAQFFERHKKSLVSASGIAGAASLVLGGGISSLILAILTAGLLLGIFYSLRLEPRALKVGRVMNFPASKTIVVTAGWTITLAVLPLLAFPDVGKPSWIIASVFIFGLTLLRLTIVELRDMQGDRIVGKRTLPIVFGKDNSLALLGAVCAGIAVMLIAGVLNGMVAFLPGVLMLIPVAYAGLCLYLLEKKFLGHGGLTEAALDVIFFSAGALSLGFLL